MSVSTENKIRAGFGLALGLLLLVAAASYLSAKKSARAFQAAANTDHVMEELERVLLATLNVETASRGYAATASQPFLEPFDEGQTMAQRSLTRLRALIGSDAAQQARLGRIEGLISQNISRSRDLIQTRQNRGLEAAVVKLTTGEGKEVVDEIRKTIAEMERVEGQLLKEITRGAEGSARATMEIAIAGALLAVIMVGTAGFVVRHDFERRQRAEQERDRFFDLSLDLLCIANTDGYFKRVNPAFTQALGWSPEELVAHPFLDFVHPDDHRATMGEVEKLAAGQKVLHFENRYRCKDGSWRVLSWKSVPQPDGTLHASARDVTEENRANAEIERLNGDLRERAARLEAAGQELRMSEARYRTLFDSIDEGFCIIEMIFDEQEKPVDYRFLQINPSFERQTGLANAQGKLMRELAPLHEQHWFEIYGRIAMTGEPARFQNRAEQLHRWYDVYAFRHGEPEKRQVAILFNDITARKRAEQELNRVNEELAQHVAQVEAANKELEAFSYSVSHDLRAPLRHIDGYVGRLTKATGEKLDEKSRRYLKTISDAAKEMGQLIDDLLLFSRVGRVEMLKGTVDLGQLVKEVAVGVEADAHGRTIVWKCGPLPKVLGDHGLLKQVFVNLLSNAVKYTRPRTPAQIEIGLAGEPNGEAVVFVRDNGVGFDMAYVDKLFGVFQRLHRSDEFEGTGVGLANVRRIVQRHGGRAWAEGQVDKGATFYVSLPTAKEG